MSMTKHTITLSVNGDVYELAVDPWRTLVEVLRDDLGLIGTKIGCQTGDCGACTVLVDGKSICSCMTLAVESQGKEITTIEGLAPGGEELHPIQEEYVARGAVQCGYCTPGMIMSTKFLLDKNPEPTETEIRRALSGNLCRCTGYNRIVEAIGAAAERIKTTGEEG